MTVAAGTRLALQLILTNKFGASAFQLLLVTSSPSLMHAREKEKEREREKEKRERTREREAGPGRESRAEKRRTCKQASHRPRASAVLQANGHANKERKPEPAPRAERGKKREEDESGRERRDPKPPPPKNPASISPR